MLKKGQKIEICIEKIVNGGEGLGYYNDMAVFVPMSVPNDLVEIEIISVKKTYARGLIQKIIKPGEDRVDDLSRITFEDFQGCDFAMLKYPAQLKFKTEMVKDVMAKIGKNSQVKVKNIIGADNEKNYRNKIIEPFSYLNNRIVSGFYRRKSHQVFEVEENMLNSKLGNKIIETLKNILNREKVSVYDEVNHSGILRHIMVRTNTQNEAMVVLIINAKKVEKRYKDILMELKNKIQEIKSIYVSLNNKRTNVALGEKNIHIWGEKHIKENLFGIEFNISPKSFFQINVEQTKKLYQKAIESIDNIENKIIVDAYSGTGTIAMIMSQKAQEIIAIEIVESATLDGIRSSQENNIQNIEFINGSVEDKLTELVKSGRKIDAIVFDPPRKGIDELTLNIVAENNIKELVYISCNPSTFARDMEILMRLGYKIDEVQPVDMFPGTSHIEVVGRFYK